MSLRRARTCSGLLAAALALVASGCGGPDAATPAKPTRKAAPEPVVVVNPLTGSVVKSRPRHGVVTLKVDNSRNSAPQVGLGSADLVVEELVEGGITRLAASFYSKVPANAGPVRSMRASDIGIVKPLKSTLVTSGGAAQTLTRIRDAEIDFVEEGAPGFYREPSRAAPYDLFVKLDELVKALGPGRVVEPYLPFGTSPLPAGRKASGVTATFSTSSSTSFTYAPKGYLNTNSFASAQDQFVPQTVLVLRVVTRDAGYTDPAGYSVPETVFTGTGAAMIFHDGRVVSGTWTKDGLDATIALQVAGEEVSLPPGKVWIELVPATTGSVSVVR